MKSDFEQNQQQGYFVNWKTSYDYPLDPSLSTVNESPKIRYTYKLHRPPKAGKPLLIEEKTFPFLLSISQEKKHILIDSKTFYIKDIRDRKDTPFNTIVFNLDGPPLVTTETSQVIMNRYFNEKPLSYAFIQYIAKSLGFHHRCPYVSGHNIFVPETGSANDSTSWYAMHHIIHTVELKKSNQMKLTIRQDHELLLDISPHSFNEQVERAAILSHVQYVAIKELAGLYPDISTFYYLNELNIVERRLKNPEFTPVRYPLRKLVHFVSHYRLNEMLEKIFKENNPYIDEVKNQFIKDFKKNPPFK